MLICPRKFLPNFQLAISIERRVGLKFPTVNEGEFREALQSPHVALSHNTNHYLTVFEVFKVALLLHTVFYHILITSF